MISDCAILSIPPSSHVYSSSHLSVLPSFLPSHHHELGLCASLVVCSVKNAQFRKTKMLWNRHVSEEVSPVARETTFTKVAAQT